jgi:hypothetical protein
LTDFARYFKKIVYLTNHQNVEKALLARENLRQSIRLILSNAFADEEPQLTALFLEMYADIPSLFDSLLPRSETEVYKSTNIELQDEGEASFNNLCTKVEGDDAEPNHIEPAVIGRIQAKYCKEKWDLPVRSSEMKPEFQSRLGKAYRDYGMKNIISFGVGGIQWVKKLAFDDR